VILSILLIALAFGLIVFFHESGHFLAARATGMTVHEFSIGFGRPLLFWFRRGNTQYSFRLWPFLSYVRIAGMEDAGDDPNGFDRKSRPAQAFVLVMGCVMNFILAIMIYIVMGSIVGLPLPNSKIQKVMPNTPAAKVGLQPGDKLVGADGKTGLSVEQLREAIQSHPGKPMKLEVERGGAIETIPITPQAQQGYTLHGIHIRLVPIGVIGVSFSSTSEHASVAKSVRLGFEQTVSMIQLQVAGIVGMVARKVPADVMGPVGVVSTMYDEARAGLLEFLWTFAAITIAIGFLNLLPIPPLDGSRLVIVGLEAIRRKPFNKEKENLVHLVGLALFLALVIVLTYRDILRIITGKP